jgi:hypothetical protein
LCLFLFQLSSSMTHELPNNILNRMSQTCWALIELKPDLDMNLEKCLFFSVSIKMFDHNRKWGTSSSSYYFQLVDIYSIDHRYRIKKSCHCSNVLIKKTTTNIGSSLSWDSTLRYKCEQSSHLSLSLSRSSSSPQRLVPIQFISPE